MLSVVAAISACGASGIAGDPFSPYSCGLWPLWDFNDLAMQVVGVGFVIGVVQDSPAKQPWTLQQMSLFTSWLPSMLQTENFAPSLWLSLVKHLIPISLGNFPGPSTQRTTKLILATCLACFLAYFRFIISSFSWNHRSLEPLRHAQKHAEISTQSPLFHAP